MKVFKVGIAGYGVVGRRRHHFIDKHDNLKVTAVCDRSFQESGVLESGVKCFNDYQKLLDEDLDALFVCVPNYLAWEITIAGLEKDLHVFCEKPPGRNLEDIGKVILCEQKHPNLVLKYGFNHRYHDSVIDALKMIRSGEFGSIINMRGIYGKSKIISFQSDWRTRFADAGGGILLDQGIHMVDLMRLFAGDFVEVKSFISNKFWNHDVEDNAYALLRTESNVFAMLHSSATQWRHRFELEIALQKGTIVLAGILSGSKSYGAETLTVAFSSEEGNGDPKEIRTKYNEDNSWWAEILEFADCMINNKKVENGSSNDALHTMQLVYQIYCADSNWKEEKNLSADLPYELK